MEKTQTTEKSSLKKNIEDIRPGDRVKVFQKIKEKDKERIQIFEGLVIARKHGNEIGATITVRRVIDGVGVERIFPLHLPTIEKIEIVKRSKVRRAKLYYLRKAKGKKARLKRRDISKEMGEQMEETIPEEKEEEKNIIENQKKDKEGDKK